MSSGPKNQTTTTKTEFPDWYNDQSMSNLILGNNEAMQGYQPYTGQRFAGNNQWFQGAGSLINDPNFGSFDVGGKDQLSASFGGMDSAINNLNGFNYNPQQVNAGMLKDVDMSQYMNPYTQNVIDQSMGDMNRQREIAQQGNASKAAAAGAFGGSRHGLVESETNRGYSDSQANMSAQLRNEGYNNAQQAAMGDLNRDLQGQGMNQNAGLNAAQMRLGALQGAGQLAGQRGNLALGAGQQRMSGDLARYNSMMQMGQMQHGMEQNQNDFDYQQWNEGKNWNKDQVGWLAGLLNGTPTGQSSSASQPMYKNPVSGALGGALGGFGMGGIPGAIGGGLLGLFG